MAGLEGQQVILLLEDYQFVHPAFLEMVNSLLSSGAYSVCLLKTENFFQSALMLGNKAIFFFFCVGKQACVGSISGEVPGLYSPEELEPLLSPLKDAASQDGFTGPLYNYFSYSQSCILIGCGFRVAHYFCLFSSLRHVCPLFVLSGKKVSLH